MNLLWVCAGGAVGSGARFLVGLVAVRWLGSGFPWGTFGVNTLGSCLLGLLMASTEGTGIREDVRLALGTGAMGGFTTYSTFNLDILRMMERQAWGLAFIYAGATLLSGLVGGAAGLALGRMLR